MKLKIFANGFVIICEVDNGIDIDAFFGSYDQRGGMMDHKKGMGMHGDFGKFKAN